MLALAQKLRVEDGSGFVESEHVCEAVERLDLEVEKRSARPQRSDV